MPMLAKNHTTTLGGRRVVNRESFSKELAPRSPLDLTTLWLTDDPRDTSKNGERAASAVRPLERCQYTTDSVSKPLASEKRLPRRLTAVSDRRREALRRAAQ